MTVLGAMGAMGASFRLSDIRARMYAGFPDLVPTAPEAPTEMPLARPGSRDPLNLFTGHCRCEVQYVLAELTTYPGLTQ